MWGCFVNVPIKFEHAKCILSCFCRLCEMPPYARVGIRRLSRRRWGAERGQRGRSHLGCAFCCDSEGCIAGAAASACAWRRLNEDVCRSRFARAGSSRFISSVTCRYRFSSLPVNDVKPADDLKPLHLAVMEQIMTHKLERLQRTAIRMCSGTSFSSVS